MYIDKSFPDKSASIELRQIQDFPPFPRILMILMRWARKFNTFVNDHFFFRGYIINNASKILYYHGVSMNKDVLLGQDGWMFLSTTDDVIDKYRGIKKLPSAEGTNWINVMSSRVDFSKKRGIGCWLIIVPEKSTVYPEYLPRWCTKFAPELYRYPVSNT